MNILYSVYRHNYTPLRGIAFLVSKLTSIKLFIDTYIIKIINFLIITINVILFCITALLVTLGTKILYC